MTPEEKQKLIEEYGQTCALLGEAIIAIETARAKIPGLKDKCKELLKKIQGKNEIDEWPKT